MKTPDFGYLLSRILSPCPGESIYDPFMRTGKLLSSFLNTIGDVSEYKLFAEEKYPGLYREGVENLNIPQLLASRSDALLAPAFYAGKRLQKFDVCISALYTSAPPDNSIEEAGYKYKWRPADMENIDPFDRWHRGYPIPSDIVSAGISHIAEVSQRAGIIIGHGAFNKAQRTEKIRGALFEEGLVDTIIDLPPNSDTFKRVPTSIIILNQSRKQDKKVLFIDASDLGTDKQTGSYTLDDIAEIYHSREVIPGFSAVAEIECIRECNYSTNLSNYFPQEEIERLSDDEFKALLQKNKDLHKELNKLDQEMDALIAPLTRPSPHKMIENAAGLDEDDIAEHIATKNKSTRLKNK